MCLHPRAGRPAPLSSAKALVTSVSTDPDGARPVCWTQRAVCPSPCHVLGTRAEGPSPCAASSTACAVSAPPTERPRGLESPGVRRGRACEHPLWPSIPALGPGLPLGLQSKTWPRPQGAHGLAGVLSDISTRDLRARWGQPGRCLWRRHLAATREAGAWGRGQPHGNTWWPLGLAGRWARGGAGRGLPPGPKRPQAGPAHLRTPGGCS